MQNSKCRMQNEGVRFAHIIKIISEGNTTILHFAFCILHFERSLLNDNLPHNCLIFHWKIGGFIFFITD